MIINGFTSNKAGKVTGISLNNGQNFEPIVEKLLAYSYVETEAEEEGEEDVLGYVYFKKEVNEPSADMVVINTNLDGSHSLDSVPIVVDSYNDDGFVSEEVEYTRAKNHDVRL